MAYRWILGSSSLKGQRWDWGWPFPIGRTGLCTHIEYGSLSRKLI